jgi:poly(hydroxyalkanoate) depolymerase family esterase
MPSIDWRELYAQNQAAIANAGIRLPATPLASLLETSLPRVRETTNRHPDTTPKGHDPLVHRRRHRPAGRARPRRGEHAAIRALVHVPPGLDTSVPAPVVCMLHGCTQDAATFAAATAMNETADRHGFVVVYPGQPRERNMLGCWNWFLPEHHQRGGGEPKLLADIVRGVIAKQSGQTIDPRRIFVAGLSAGGAMALILAVCYPDLFAAVAVHSGLPYRAAENVISALAMIRRPAAARAPDRRAIHTAMGEHARPVPSLVIHGTDDNIVAPENARHILAQSMHANHLAAPQTCAHDPAKPNISQRARANGGLTYTHNRWLDANGALMHEAIEVQGLAHAWSGGVPGGSYTDPRGPSATKAIWAFFANAARAPTETTACPVGDTTPNNRER